MAIPALVVSLFVSADMVSSMLSAIPEFVTRGLQIAGGFIVVVGYAMVLRMMGVKYLMPFFSSVSRRGYLDFSLLAFGGVGVIIALITSSSIHSGVKLNPPPPLPLCPALTSLTTNGAENGTEKSRKATGEHVSPLQPPAGLL